MKTYIWPPQQQSAAGQYITLQYTTPAGTNGGSATAGAWTARPLNTIQYDGTGAVTLVSDRFVLPAGTYNLSASAGFYGNAYSYIRLYNVTGATVLLNPGIPGNGAAAYLAEALAVLAGEFTVAAGQTLELQYFINTINIAGDFNLGAGGGLGAGTITHTNIQLVKIA